MRRAQECDGSRIGGSPRSTARVQRSIRLQRHAVVRLESISAVRIPETMADAPVAETFDEHHELAVAEARDDGAYAMPEAASA